MVRHKNVVDDSKLNAQGIRYITNIGYKNTPGTAGGPGGRDRSLAVKSRKTDENQFFFRKKIEITIFFAYTF